MTDPRVLCLGEILFDRLADQPGLPVTQVKSWTDYPGGAPANVATALIKLGTPAAFIGCVGQDPSGDRLVTLLNTVGVNVQALQRHPSAPTRSVYVVRSLTGDRQFAGFGDQAPDAFADAQLQSSQLPNALFAAADYLVMGTLELAYPTTRQGVERALTLADDYFVKVVLDVNWRPMFWQDPAQAKPIIEALLPKVDFLKLSDEEAEWLFQTKDPRAIAKQLDSIEGVLITAGEEGCAYYLSDVEGRFPAFSVEVEDTTGAGDGFLAGFLHQLCERGLNSLRDPGIVNDVITFATAVGALTTTRPGAIAAQPTPEEVSAFLSLHSQ